MTLMTIMIIIMTSIKFKIKDICRLVFYTIIHIFYTLPIFTHHKQTVDGMCGPSDKAVFFLVSGGLARRFFFPLSSPVRNHNNNKTFASFWGEQKKKRERKNLSTPFSLSCSLL